MKNIILLFIFCIFFSVVTNAQMEQDHPSSEHNDSEEESGIYEIITSGIYSYSFEHDEGVIGTEVHLTYWFTHKWAGGFSYTAKYEEEETLHDFALLFGMNPNSWITINAGPNFAFEGKNREFELGAYGEIEINVRPTEWFHFGPVIGTVIGENTEGSVGIHIGFEF